MSKDAEIERAFERAERDEEKRGSARRLFGMPCEIWEDPEPCPECGSDQVFKLVGHPPAWPDLAQCLDCTYYWKLETDNERENNGT